MKNFHFIACFLGVFLLSHKGFTQDTLKLKNKSFLVCKVHKISETEIEYKKWENLEGPLYTIDRNKVFEIKFENGTVEKIIADEMDVNKEYEILDKRNSIKLDLFSPAFDKLTFGFEHSLKVGWNVEGYFSFISNKLLPNSFSRETFYNDSPIQGIGLKLGNKFFIGSDYYIKGTKYAHPLKGRFIRLDLAYNQFTVKDIYRYKSTNYPYYLTTYDKGNINASQFSLSISYGRQFLLGNLFSLQYNIGLGYVGTYSSFVVTDLNVSPPINNHTYYNENYDFPFGSIPNVIQFGNLPIGVSANLTLGYVLGKKESPKKPIEKK